MRAIMVDIAKHKALPYLKDAEVGDLDKALDLWRKLGGPRSNKWLLSEPDASAKSRKSVRPEYMLYLTPHRLAKIENLCPWSTSGCRKHCLHSAGRGAQPNVAQGRLVRTQLLFEAPELFLAILADNLRLVDKRGGGWVRLNGTSDIPWEEVPAVVEMMERYSSTIDFADYTKAMPSKRPAPDIDNYSLARSVWFGHHDAFDIRDLLLAGERVSMVVDDPEKLRGLDLVTMADDTDEWLLEDGPQLGVLKPKGSLRKDPSQVYSYQVVETALELYNEQS